MIWCNRCSDVCRDLHKWHMEINGTHRLCDDYLIDARECLRLSSLLFRIDLELTGCGADHSSARRMNPNTKQVPRNVYTNDSMNARYTRNDRQAHVRRKPTHVLHIHTKRSGVTRQKIVFQRIATGCVRLRTRRLCDASICDRTTLVRSFIAIVYSVAVSLFVRIHVDRA